MYSLHYYKKAVLPVQLLELSLSVCTSSEQIIQLFRQHLAFVHYILSTEVPVPTTCTLPMMQADNFSRARTEKVCSPVQVIT